jgi:ribosomal protein S5
MELAGVPNVVGKIMRGSNKINTLKAAVLALGMLRNRNS